MTKPSAALVRVLVVDDYRDVADSQAMLLQLWGYDVRVAYGGPAALVAADTYRPQVILLDVGMPGMSGWEVARRLRERTDFRQALLVAMTAYDEADDFQCSWESGFDHHLVKPVDPTRLQELLAALTGSGDS